MHSPKAEGWRREVTVTRPTKPIAGEDDIMIVDGRRFVIEPSENGCFMICTWCGERIGFGLKAKEETIRADLREHRCAEVVNALICF